MINHFGIDYGSKLAGTTVICFFNGDYFELHQTTKNQDADQFIFEFCQTAGLVFIDAPLSLPGVYRALPGYHDYFYREADKQVQAMSPLFLGGLTARAMQLRARFREKTQFTEVYPGGLARSLQLNQLGYKKEKEKLPICLALTVDALGMPPALHQAAEQLQCSNWHQFDAFLAWCIGWKVQQKTAVTVGKPEEGMIHF